MLLIASQLIAALLGYFWLYRSRANLDALNVTGLNYSPGWCVGWWFIPVANLVMPYRVFSEIDRGSRWRDKWVEHGTPGLVTTWWLAYLFYGLLLRGSQALAKDNKDLMLIAIGMEIVARVLAIIAALSFARLVLRVHEAQVGTPAEAPAANAAMLAEPA